MRTNIVIEDSLLEDGFRVASVKTKKALIHLALKEFVQNHSRQSLADLRGKIQFQEGYDYKSLRESRPF